MKAAILQAAVLVLVERGLNNWTVDEVARRAGCAKGLVNYHYRTKQDLLRQAAQFLRDERWKRRVAAATSMPAGTNPIDRLWEALQDEVRSGRFAAWLSLLSAGERFRQAAASPAGEPQRLTAALNRSLELGDRLTPHAWLIEAGLSGFQLRLLQGDFPAPPPLPPPEELEEAYHRFWLTVLEM